MECMGCFFCDNEAPTQDGEFFPKYVIVKTKTMESVIVCRDCFELWYKGAAECNRTFRPTSQSTVYIYA